MSINTLSFPTMVISYVLLLAWAFVVLFPLYWLAVTSFKTPLDVNGGPFYIPWRDFQPNLDNWHYIFVDLGEDTFRPYLNTVVVGLTSTTITLVLGSMAAYGLVRLRYLGVPHRLFARLRLQRRLRRADLRQSALGPLQLLRQLVATPILAVLRVLGVVRRLRSRQ